LLKVPGDSLCEFVFVIHPSDLSPTEMSVSHGLSALPRL